MENVLLVGQDSVLLDARANALAETGVLVTCCNASEFDLRLWNETYDLVVLCHTLKPGVERSLIATEVYRRWPQARILQVVSSSSRFQAQSGFDGNIVVGDMGEQGELVEMSLELLGKSRQAKWRPLSNRLRHLPLAS